MKRYTLTLSCQDRIGIVAAVAGCLSSQGGFIIESAQFGDPSTGIFFMRTVFDMQDEPGGERFHKAFAQVALRFSMEWQMHDMSVRNRVVVMVSKQGHCLNDLLYRFETEKLFMDVVAVISNHEDYKGLVEWHGIPFYYIPVLPATKAEQEAKVWDIFVSHQADLLVLARYMQVLSPAMVRRLHGRAINIHHSFLPSFKGAKPYHQAYDRGVKLIGATAHFVTDDLDEGPIIEQEVMRVDHTHMPEDLAAIGGDIESRVLSRAVKYFVEHRVLMNGNKTVVFL